VRRGRAGAGRPRRPPRRWPPASANMPYHPGGSEPRSPVC
jgi:hypothetical protein